MGVILKDNFPIFFAPIRVLQILTSETNPNHPKLVEVSSFEFINLFVSTIQSMAGLLSFARQNNGVQK